MICDLHIHYPMHVVPPGRDNPIDAVGSPRGRARLLDRVRAAVIHGAGRFANYGSFESGPRATIPRMHAGGVKVGLSVLYSFWDEMDWPRGANSPPDARYFSRLIRQLELVEEELARDFAEEAVVVRDPSELRAALAGDATVLVHAVEGGFHLGPDTGAIGPNVHELAERGVAYVTVGHLFNRSVTEVANAIPFVPDWLWKVLFAQPTTPLHAPAKEIIRACVEERVMVDVCHMTGHALDATLSLLDRLDPKREAPLLASHAGYRFGRQEYMLSERHVRSIAARGGVIGLIFAQHQLLDGLRERHTHSFDDSLDVLCRHIDRIHAVVGSHDHTGIGTDFDGFVKPTLSELDDASMLARVETALVDRYGAQDAERMTSGNGLRLLQEYWRS